MSRRVFAAAAVAALLVAPAAAGDPPAAAPPGDAIDQALALQHLTRKDVGWQARGTWEGYPIVPYKLRHFDDLVAEPFATVPWVRAMGAAVKQYLSPEKLTDKGVRGSGALMQAVHALGINRRFGGLRSYSANLTAKPTPLDQAILAVYAAAGRPSKFVTFGQESPYPLVEKDLADAVAKLPKDVSEVLGQLVLNLVDAHRWADLAFRNVPMEKRLAVARRLDLGQEEVDALDYEPAVDDVAATWDEASLWYAAMKTVEALDQARVALTPLVETLPKPQGDITFGPFVDCETPWGRIVVTGRDQQKVDRWLDAPFLVVDFGGNDEWQGPVASATPTQSLAAMLDLGGDDLYLGMDRAHGAGVCGVGVLLDAGGNDTYTDGTLSQGAGQFGFGALIDLGGDDKYSAAYSSQGAGFFGVGLLFDCAGDDRYEIWSDGQGFGGVAGVGVLADRSGDDKYVAVTDPNVTKRPSYHQLKDAPIVSVSNAQGCAMGRRGDGSDGHSWAGGLGALLDAEGNDTYTAANWAQGTGYWFGTGVLWDGGGNDTYSAEWWNCASGAHFCIGALVDEAGDDKYTCRATNGIAFGHDFTLAVLCDLAGDDTYTSATPTAPARRASRAPRRSRRGCSTAARRPSCGPSRRRSACSSTPGTRASATRRNSSTRRTATTSARATSGSRCSPRRRSTPTVRREGSDERRARPRRDGSRPRRRPRADGRVGHRRAGAGEPRRHRGARRAAARRVVRDAPRGAGRRRRRVPPARARVRPAVADARREPPRGVRRPRCAARRRRTRSRRRTRAAHLRGGRPLDLVDDGAHERRRARVLRRTRSGPPSGDRVPRSLGRRPAAARRPGTLTGAGAMPVTRKCREPTPRRVPRTARGDPRSRSPGCCVQVGAGRAPPGRAPVTRSSQTPTGGHARLQALPDGGGRCARGCSSPWGSRRRP
jgi:hypothetical protein